MTAMRTRGRRRWAITTVGLLLAVPAAPFVFVPVRGPGQLASVSAAQGPAQSVAVDLSGNVFAADSAGVVAANPHGDRCWRLPLSPPERCAELCLAGDQLLLLLTDGQHWAARSVNRTDGSPRWRVDVAGDSSQAHWRLPRHRDGQPYGTLALLSAGHLSVINLARGTLLGHVDLGTTQGNPLWVEDSGFVVTSNGGRNEVVGVDVVTPGTPARPFVRAIWRAPLGESLTRLAWDETARALVVYGRARTYVVQDG